jgi:hypothetical protein
MTPTLLEPRAGPAVVDELKRDGVLVVERQWGRISWRCVVTLSLKEGAGSACVEVQPHDCAVRTRALDAREAQVIEELLPAEEGIGGALDGSGQGPAFDCGSSLSASQLDRCAQERVRNALSSALGLDEDARYEPDGRDYGGNPTLCDLTLRSSSTLVSGPRTASAPTHRLASPSRQDAHGRRSRRGEVFEASAVATVEPPGGELDARRAERHAPAVAGGSVRLEQLGQVCQLVRAHGANVDVRAHDGTLYRRTRNVARLEERARCDLRACRKWILTRTRSGFRTRSEPDPHVAATGPGAFASRRDEVIGAVLDAERDASEQVCCHYIAQSFMRLT